MGGYISERKDYARIFKDITTNANNTTVSVPLFQYTGHVACRIRGKVLVNLSSNITAAHFRANDQTNTPAITLAAGTTLSSAVVGAAIVRNGLVGAAIVLLNADQTRVSEHATSGLEEETWFELTTKPGVTNTIDFRYSTTNTPASGSIRFRLDWKQLDDSGLVVPV